MPKRLVIYTLAPSDSATLIADEMGCKKVRKDGTYIPRSQDIILGWGAYEKPNWGDNLNGAKILNRWDRVEAAANKHKTFDILKAAGVRIPEYTTDPNVAKTWVGNSNWVLGRQLLNASQGQGIILCKTAAEIDAAQGVKLWVRYFKSSREFRIFCAKDPVTGAAVVIDGIEKKKKQDPGPNYSPNIRSNENGWAFCRLGITIPDCIKEEAKKTLLAMNLDLGAIDIRFNPEIGGSEGTKVLEINTKFGICSENSATLESVTEALDAFLNNEAIVEVVSPQSTPIVPQIVPTAPQVIPAVQPKVATSSPAKSKSLDFSVFQDIRLVEENGILTVWGKIPGMPQRMRLATGAINSSLADLFE